MKIIEPSVELIAINADSAKLIEAAGRTCYKSEDRITYDSADKFISMVRKRHHDSVIEHASASFRIITDRGISHEIVRHRLFSYAQESTRYCNYSGGVTFIIPCWLYSKILETDSFHFGDNSNSLDLATRRWIETMLNIESIYRELIIHSWTPQQARVVLPNSLKTEIVITGNLREWRHFFTLRTAKAAHPQMQEVANMLLKDIRKRVDVLFNDLTV